VTVTSCFSDRHFTTSSQAAELHLTVNGRPVTVPDGSTLFDATSKLGAFVPTLCKHPRLPNTPGACRYSVGMISSSYTIQTNKQPLKVWQPRMAARFMYEREYCTTLAAASTLYACLRSVNSADLLKRLVLPNMSNEPRGQVKVEQLIKGCTTCAHEPA
jgi:hypothetical protein